MVCWHHARGGEGAVDLGRALIKACQQPTSFKFLYSLEASIKVRPYNHACMLPNSAGTVEAYHMVQGMA